MHVLTVRCPVDAYSGYGRLSISIIRFLRDCGVPLNIEPFFVRDDYDEIPEDVASLIRRRTLRRRFQLMIGPPDRIIETDTNTIVFTMWESSRLRPVWVRHLNRSRAIILPSDWNLNCFRNSGVTAPLLKCPLGVDLREFSYRPAVESGVCVFGACANLEGGGMRKNLNMLIEAFRAEFGPEDGVRLELKVLHSGDLASRFDEGQIRIITAFFTISELVQWYAGLTALVSVSAGEGWGLVCQEAMAIGRPLIAPRYGGITEYFVASVGFPVKFVETPARGAYLDCGNWVQVDQTSLREQLRFVYNNRPEAARRGERAALSAMQFSWEGACRCLWQILVSNQFITS